MIVDYDYRIEVVTANVRDGLQYWRSGEPDWRVEAAV